MSQDTMQRKPHILIVDDEPSNRLLLTRLLERDYRVNEAENGQEALEKLSLDDYDAILLDLMMPVMNGMETLQHIREELDLSTLPVIIVSAKNDPKTMLNGIEHGANDFLPKPIDVQMVRARLRTQITLKQLADERKMVTDALREANEMKLRMMEIASHDLKNPLNNLSLMMSLLKESIGDVPDMPNFMDMIDENIETMSQIISDFLDANESMSTNLTITILPYSSEKIVTTVLRQHALAAQIKSIDIIYETDNDALIRVDKARMEQVLNNLVSNAIKYSPLNGTVTVKSKNFADYWRLEVEDTGPGIPEEEREYLFEAFSKSYISTKPTNGEPSTGLGLWIAAEMMKVQGGTIGMETAPTGGCCFWIEVPLDEELISASA